MKIQVILLNQKAIDEVKYFYLKDITNIAYVVNMSKNADGLILLTEWKELRSKALKEYQLKSPIIFDGR